MKILKKTRISTIFVSLTILCTGVLGKTISNPTQTPKKEANVKQLGKELLNLLQDLTKKYIKISCPCCPSNQSCAIETNTDAAIEEQQADRKKDIQRAIELIEKGADVNAINENGTSPLYLATLLDDLQLVKILLQKNAQLENEIMSPLIVNIMFGGKKEILDLLLAYGANVNAQINKIWHTPLMVAVSKNNLELTKLLLEKNADVNIQAAMIIPNIECSFTALNIAIAMNNIKIVELLLENGANPNIKSKVEIDTDDKKEKTALEQAKKEDSKKEIIDLLLRHGAK